MSFVQKILFSKFYSLIWIILITTLVFRKQIYFFDSIARPFEIAILIFFPILLLSILKPFKNFTQSSKILIFIFSIFIFLNLLSNQINDQYLDFHSNLLYYVRLLVIFFISVVAIESISENINLLKAHSKGYLLGLFLVFVCFLFFPQFKSMRPVATFDDPNFLAGFLIIPLNICFFSAFIEKTLPKKLFYFVCFCFTIFIIFSTLSRAGIIAAFISLFILVLYILSKKITLNTLIKFGFLVASFIFLAFFLLSFNANYRDELLYRFSAETLVNQTDQERQILWQKAFYAIKENPLGYGMGQMRIKIREENSRSVIIGYTTESHNLFLQVGGAFGWLGLLVFIIFIVYLFICIFRIMKIICYKEKRRRVILFSIPIASSFFGIFFHAMFMNYLYARYFWIIAASLSGCFEFLKKRRYFSKSHAN